MSSVIELKNIKPGVIYGAKLKEGVNWVEELLPFVGEIIHISKNKDSYFYEICDSKNKRISNHDWSMTPSNVTIYDDCIFDEEYL